MECGEFPKKGEPEKTKVVVVGAGFSGLSAAYHLTREGHFDVKVVEARDRLGGRVHTVGLVEDTDGGTNQIVELGGQWVHEASERNPIKQLMEKLELGFASSMSALASETEWRSDEPDGVLRNVVFDSLGEKIGTGPYKEASRIFYKSLDQHVPTSDGGRLDDMSMQDVLDEFFDLQLKSDSRLGRARNIHGFVETMNYLRHRTECYEGGKLSELSASVDLYENLGGPDELPLCGYAPLIDAVVKTIGEDNFILNFPVSCITYDPSYPNDSSQPVVLTSNQADVDSISADFCICTIPLGVLQRRRVVFQPEPSALFWNAVDSIGMGNLEKVILQFDSRFWDRISQFGVGHRDPSKVKSFFSTDSAGTILYMFLGGAAAERLYTMSDEEAVIDAIEALRTVFGKDSVSTLVESWVSRWRKDEFSGGAYSFAKVGVTSDDYDRVGKPLGNLFFAGEHTNPTAHSTVHGAWQTGARESGRLVRLLRKSNRN